jgi:hypothetical protein
MAISMSDQNDKDYAKENKLMQVTPTFYGKPTERYYKDNFGFMQGRWTTYSKEGNISEEYMVKDSLVTAVITIKDEKGRNCILPAGQITTWKACISRGGNFVYVELLVPADAKRVTPFNEINDRTKLKGYKARVSKAKVISIKDKEGNDYTESSAFVFSPHGMMYKVGETIEISDFNDNVSSPCGAGISCHLHRDHCDQWKEYITSALRRSILSWLDERKN